MQQPNVVANIIWCTEFEIARKSQRYFYHLSIVKCDISFAKKKLVKALKPKINIPLLLLNVDSPT